MLCDVNFASVHRDGVRNDGDGCRDYCRAQYRRTFDFDRVFLGHSVSAKCLWVVSLTLVLVLALAFHIGIGIGIGIGVVLDLSLWLKLAVGGILLRYLLEETL